MSDDVPILATRRTQASCWYSKLKPATQTTSPSCAPARDQDPRDAEPLHLMVDVRQRLGRGDVVEGDDALDLAADQPELVLAEALDATAVRLGPDDDDALVGRLRADAPRGPATPSARPARAHPRR